MTARLATGLFVAALMRRVQEVGGSAMLLARGDDSAGGLIVVCAERGEIVKIIERGHDINDRLVWRPIDLHMTHVGTVFNDYLLRRRNADPDLWAIELDTPDSERFVADLTQVN